MNYLAYTDTVGEKRSTMFPGHSNPHDPRSGAHRSPRNVLRSRGKQARADDGFHTRAVRDPRVRRRKVTIVAAAVACVLAVILVLRATGDRDERLQDTNECIRTYGADVCDQLDAAEAEESP